MKKQDRNSIQNQIYSERASLFEPNICIYFIFKINGACTAEDVKAAANRAFCANATTMSKIVLADDGTAYYEKMEKTGCSVSIVDETEDFEHLIKVNEKKQMNIQSGEMMRIFIEDALTKEVLVMAHHLVGDGKSVVYFIEQMMNALSGNRLEYRPYHLITDSTFQGIAKLPFFYKMYLAGVNRKWRKRQCIFDWKHMKKLFDTYWKERSSVIYTEHFSAKEVEALHGKAKKCGVSMNSYITTAFLKENDMLSIAGMAVDARLDGNRCMSNQATGITVNYHYHKKKTFDENVRQFHQCAITKLNRKTMKYFILLFMPALAPELVDAMLMSANGLYDNKVSKELAKVMTYSTEKANQIGITNLTRLDIPNEYGDYTISDLCFIPPVVSYARQVVGIATMKDGMSIAYHCNSDTAEGREDYFKRVMNALK